MTCCHKGLEKGGRAAEETGERCPHSAVCLLSEQFVIVPSHAQVCPVWMINAIVTPGQKESLGRWVKLLDEELAYVLQV